MNPSNSHRTTFSNGHSERSPIALAIGGSDPTGGAGIQADLKTFQQFGVHGLSVITAVTAQNTHGVLSTNPVPAEVVRAQLSALSEDFPIDAIKIGMLTTSEVVEAVADFLEQKRIRAVLDPVLAPSNGVRFLDDAALETLVRCVIPLASLITPNIPEASRLMGSSIASEAEMQHAAQRLIEAGAGAVLLKGGHGEGAESRDLFFDGAEFEWLSAPRSTKRVHGTGCVLSSAVASGLALGMPMIESVRTAKDFISEMIERAVPLGTGQEIFQFTSSTIVA